MFRPMGAVDPTLQAGIDALPPCYSWELHECINPSKVQPPELAPFPRCAAVEAAYEADEDGMETAVDSIPFCPHREDPEAYLAEPKTNWAMLGATAVLSVALGFFVGRMA